MNTLVEINKDKETLIKLINKHRLENKNSWYQLSIALNGLNYEMKCFETWVQICYVYKNNKLLYNAASPMELSVKQFKEYLNKVLK